MKLFLTDIAGNKNHNKIMFRNPCEKGRAKETITSVLFVCLFVLCLFLHKSKILIYLETLKKGRTSTKINGYGSIRLVFESALPSQGFNFDCVYCFLVMSSLHAVNSSEKKRWWWWQMENSNKVNNHGKWGWRSSLEESEYYPLLTEHPAEIAERSFALGFAVHSMGASRVGSFYHCGS